MMQPQRGEQYDDCGWARRYSAAHCRPNGAAEIEPLRTRDHMRVSVAVAAIVSANVIVAVRVRTGAVVRVLVGMRVPAPFVYETGQRAGADDGNRDPGNERNPRIHGFRDETAGEKQRRS